MATVELSERRRAESDLVREAVAKVLPGRLFIVLFQGADDQDAVCSNMDRDGTLMSLKLAVRELERGRVN